MVRTLFSLRTALNEVVSKLNEDLEMAIRGRNNARETAETAA